MSVPSVLITSVILLCFCSSCRKEDTPAAGDRLLQRVVARSGDTIIYSSLQYDAQMRLVAITDSSNNGGYTGETTIEYDTSGKPAKFIHFDLYPNRPGSDWADLLVYKNGKVIQKLTSSFNNGYYVSAHNYTYDTKGRLVKDSVGSYGYTSFAYDDNDNVIQIQEFDTSPGTMTNTCTITASHDSNINPYNGLDFNLYFFITNSYNLLSKHNRTKVIYSQYNLTHTGNYTYEYENGLPKKMTLTWDDGGSFAVNAVSFYYN